MLRFTGRGEDAPVKCIESDGDCGLVFTARVSRGRVNFICGCLRCLSRRQMSSAPQTCATSKCTSGQQASTWKQATRVMSRRCLKTTQFATKRKTFLEVCELFVF